MGAVTLVTSESKKLYSARDLSFATELAHRIAVAADNARLYGAAEMARAAAEAMAADVAEQSKAVEKALVAMRAERDAALGAKA
jgi:GAF domain-containing protein